MTDVAQLDLTTGAYQRGAFEELLAAAVSRAVRSGEPLSLIYVDLDNVQEHNDVYGRERMDSVLSSIASVISREVDGAGPIGRIDGDAFVIALSGVALEEAAKLAERIRRCVSSVLPLAPSVRQTVSAGVAQLKQPEPWGNLLEAAEEACTRAKQRGRNAVATR